MPHNPELPYPKDVIPHRPPHLWLDGVTEVTPGVAGYGFWEPDAVQFDGHFDSMPMLMGVKQIEALAQLGAYVMMVENDNPSLGIFKGIENTVFRSAIQPGQTLDLQVEIIEKGKRDFKGNGTVRVAGAIACQATILGSLMPVEAAQRLFSVRFNSTTP